jgi:conjugal transfer ATP-binding protein TraC
MAINTQVFSHQQADEDKQKSLAAGALAAEDQKKLLEAEKVFFQGVATIRDLISPASMRIDSRTLELNGQFIATLFVINYPRYINVGWFSPIINYPSSLDVSMYFYPVKSEVILKQLRNKVGALEAQLSTDREKGAPRDPLRETALQDIEKLRDDLTQGVEKFFQFCLYITLYANTKEELEKLVNKMESIVGSKLIYTKRAFYQAEQGFNSTLPLCNDELQVSFNMNSSPVASSFPFVSSELTSDRGILYGINRHNNSLVIFDRFSLQNPNAVIFATSGAGKSYAVKLEILRSLMMGTEVIIIDPENEYKYLCDAVGGAYINVSLNAETKMNPFDLPRAIGDAAKPADVIRSAVITIKGLIRLLVGDLTHAEDSLVDRALIETYAKKDITPEADLSNVTPPLMSDFQSILEGMQGSEDLVLRLKKYTEGTFAGLFNSPTNIDVKNQLISFSVRDLEDELKPAAIYSIISYIWNVVRSSVKKRILVVDEAWWLMQREDSAKFLFAIVKRCRKYYLGVTTISQDVNDFLTSPYGQAIVNNSAMQLLLKQSPAAIALIQKTFMLTDGEKYLLLECNAGEGIFFAGSKHVAIYIKASSTEDQIVTTDPKQMLEIASAKREFEQQMSKTNKQ